MPNGKLRRIGVWEDGRFIGAVLFSRGANNDLGKPYGLTQIEVCELTRVALDKHKAPVSQIIAIAIKLLKRSNPGLRLIVSFADTQQGHHGGIYQAGNWIYTGKSKSSTEFIINGVQKHARSLNLKAKTSGTKLPGETNVQWAKRTLDPNLEVVICPGKHRYLYPLDNEMRAQIEQLRQDYPAPEA